MIYLLTARFRAELGNCIDSWARVLLGVSSALIFQKPRATSAGHLHCRESQTVTIGVNTSRRHSHLMASHALSSALSVALPSMQLLHLAMKSTTCWTISSLTGTKCPPA